MDYYSAIKEGNPDICNNIHERGGHYAKWNKPDRERQMLYGITCMWNQKKIQISLFTKQIQTHRHGKQTWLPKGKGGRNKLRIWNEQIDTTIYKKDNQEGPTV